MTWWLNASSIILVMTTTGVCLTGLILACCRNMRMSRCNRIKMCCCEFIRDVESAEELELELQNQSAEKNNAV